MAFFSLTIVSYALAIFMLLLQLQLIHGAHKTTKRSPLASSLIVFGDSIVDPGNNNNIISVVRCNFPPYGQDFIGNKATGRFSNGKIPTDFIASALGVKQFLPAYSEAGNQDLLTGVSFASGGTGYDTLTAQLALVIPMEKQLEMFKEYKEKLRRMAGEKKAASIISESVYMVCAGSNDVVFYHDNPLRRLTHDAPSYANFLLESALDFTKELANLGAKKIGVIGIPPIGCVPEQRTRAGGDTRECGAERNQLAQMFNSKLPRELQRLASTLNGTRLAYIDIYSTLLDLIQNPKKHGFEESTLGCCGSGKVEVAILCNQFSSICKNSSSYVFWDSFHPTERAYKVLVDEMMMKYIRLLI